MSGLALAETRVEEVLLLKERLRVLEAPLADPFLAAHGPKHELGKLRQRNDVGLLGRRGRRRHGDCRRCRRSAPAVQGGSGADRESVRRAYGGSAAGFRRRVGAVASSGSPTATRRRSSTSSSASGTARTARRAGSCGAGKRIIIEVIDVPQKTGDRNVAVAPDF